MLFVGAFFSAGVRGRGVIIVPILALGYEGLILFLGGWIYE
jgi:hypothetical protein